MACRSCGQKAANCDCDPRALELEEEVEDLEYRIEELEEEVERLKAENTRAKILVEVANCKAAGFEKESERLKKLGREDERAGENREAELMAEIEQLKKENERLRNAIRSHLENCGSCGMAKSDSTLCDVEGCTYCALEVALKRGVE